MSDTVKKNNRIAYWDNLKCFLIFLVIVGHFLIPLNPTKGSIGAVYKWIYYFHMPAFVFVSGYFSKSFVKKENDRVNKLFGYLLLYCIFNFGLWGVDYLLGFNAKYSQFTVVSAQWYLLAMFIWLAFIPYFKDIKPVIAITFLVVIGMLIGMDANAGPFLALSRVIILMPFFVAGYYIDGGFINKINLFMRLTAAGFLFAVLVFIYLNQQITNKYMTVFYCNRGYSVMNVGNTKGCMLRLGFYLITTMMMIAVMMLIPKKRNLFTFVGERSLGIFIVHRLLRDVVMKTGLYDKLNGGYKSLIVILVISFAVMMICSIKIIDSLFRKIMSIKIVKN